MPARARFGQGRDLSARRMNAPARNDVANVSERDGRPPAGVRDHLHVERGGHRADRAGEIAEAKRAKEKPGGQPEEDQADRRAPLEVQHRLLQQQAKRHVNAGRGAGLLVAEPVQVVPVAGKGAGHLDRVGADRAKRAVVREQNQRWVEAVPKQEQRDDDKHPGRAGERLEPAG